MSELNLLTIVISLAVCSLLVYAAFQYMKVRLNVLEQSQKEQALILQQFIEESSTDLHRLYKLASSNGGNMQGPPQGSIILEYANDLENEEREMNEQKPASSSSYHQPHVIHLDTAAFFQNKKSNLIEISSDSENTTESESGDAGDTSESSDSSDDDGSTSDDSSSDDDDSRGDDESDNSDDDDIIHPENPDVIMNDGTETIVNEEVTREIKPSSISASEIKLVTVDLGAMQESVIKPPSENEIVEHTVIVSEVESETTVEPAQVTPPAPAPAPASAPAPAPPTSYSSMSVPELRQLLKEKYKNNPEKHPEIQKLKKAELVYALQTAQV